jgi:formylglycine-generating enzyme required for sulfatase activity
MTINRPLRVFLCHSSQDKPAVRELYQQLRAEPWIQPWLDEEDLYPGQDWNMEIERAVEAADAIIVCLSKGSITKEGYVQRELRIVLDYADYKPEGTLYLMPVRLEECEPPRRLRPWQYADYFEGQRERAFQRLLVSLKRRADSIELEYEEKVKREAKEEADRLVAQKVEEERVAQAKIESERKAKEEADRLRAEAEERARKEYEAQQAKVREEQKPVLETPKPLPAPQISARHQYTHDGFLIEILGGMEFMRVPAGKFLMGSKNDNKLASGGEKPQHSVDIPYDYWMARFPVTNELYNAYTKSQKIEHPVKDWEKKKDHPVVYVKWTDAMAYCQWLNDLIKAELPAGLVLRLPTEAEWEKAARGTDGLEYPWGNEFDKNKCNTSEGGKGGTTPVGSYSSRGNSPYGCADMSGNVWERCHSLYKSYPYKVNDGREDEKASGARVLRGGSFIYDVRHARCAYRNGLLNNVAFFDLVGFRVVVASPVLS